MKEDTASVEVTVTEARAKLFHLLHLAAQGKEIIIRNKKQGGTYRITLLQDDDA